MAEKKKLYPSPEFHSPEEEEEYWKTHSPLAEEYEGKVQRSRQKRSSFLAVRLTGEELTRLRDVAAKQGLGPSTFARLVLTQAIEQDRLTKRVALDELLNALESNFSQEDREKVERLLKSIAIGDPENPALLIFSGQRRAWEEFTSLFLERLLGVQVIPTENEDYEKVREIVKHEPGKEMVIT